MRKKYYPSEGVPIAREDLSRLLTNLTRQGYLIFAPGQPLPSPPEFIFKNLVITGDVGALEIPSVVNESFMSVKFSLLWEAIYSQFEPLLGEDLSQVSDFIFSINILSINLNGDFSYSGSTAYSSQFQFFFNDPLSILAIPEIPQQLVAGSNNLVSLQSLGDSHYLQSYALSYPATNTNRFGFSAAKAKSESLNTQYLYSYVFNDKSILESLTDKDYDSFNPTLFNVATGGTRSGPSYVSSSSITVQVHLQYKLSS